MAKTATHGGRKPSAKRKEISPKPVSPSRHCLAGNMRLLRTMQRLSQEELGNRIGLKRSYVGAIEHLKINPGLDAIDKIASGLGVPTPLLLQDPGEGAIWKKSIRARK